MNRFRQLTGAVAATVAALSLTGCTSMTVNSYTERGADFSRYHTFAWSTEEKATGDPRLDNNPFFHERFRAEVERHLTRRGFVTAGPEGQPDLLIEYRVRIGQDVETHGVNLSSPPAYCVEGGCEPYAFDHGTLWIELEDARTKKMMWRAWAQGRVDGVVDNQEWMEQQIDEVVARIFEKFARP